MGSVARGPLMMPNGAGLPVLSLHCNCGDACRSCWAMAMQLECCRLCCSLPQPSWRSWPSQSPSPSQQPYSGPGGPCKDTLKSSGIGAPPLPPPNTPNPLSLCCGSVASAWVLCSVSVRCADDFRKCSATVCLGASVCLGVSASEGLQPAQLA